MNDLAEEVHAVEQKAETLASELGNDVAQMVSDQQVGDRGRVDVDRCN